MSALAFGWSMSLSWFDVTALSRLRFRRRIQVLSWARRIALLPFGALLLFNTHFFTIALSIVLYLVVHVALKAWENSARRQFVREASLPPFLGAKLRQAYPQLEARDTDLVLRGLRQFFMAHLRSDRRFVAMPSKLVDAAWHEFILHTKAYQQWCDAAFGGMLHHSPAEVLGRSAQRNDGLRRTWFWACKEESINPRQPARLPLLFALDAKFGVEGGYCYVPDCRDIDRQSSSGTQCGSDFGRSDGGSGDAGGFGGSDSTSGTDGSSGSSGSDGGDGGSGCGGGD